MQFLIYDRRSIERGVVVRTAYILISIQDPENPTVRIRRPPALRDVLSLAFHDAEPVRGSKLPDHIRLMQHCDAVQIWDFVQRHRAHVGTIVCHCEQGMLSTKYELKNDTDGALEVRSTNYSREFGARHSCPGFIAGCLPAGRDTRGR